MVVDGFSESRNKKNPIFKEQKPLDDLCFRYTFLVPFLKLNDFFSKRIVKDFKHRFSYKKTIVYVIRFTFIENLNKNK